MNTLITAFTPSLLDTRSPLSAVPPSSPKYYRFINPCKFPADASCEFNSHRPVHCLRSFTKGRGSSWPRLMSIAMNSTATDTQQNLDRAGDDDEDSKSKKRRSLADVWREIQGGNNWEGLVDPLDDILRREIIRYGEFAQACYDGFDFDPFSQHCGSCKYTLHDFFEGVAMCDYGYQITRYLYATSNINLPSFFKRPRHVENLWSSHANWMGFKAVARDPKEIQRMGRRDIVIAWRGTVTRLEWIADLMDYLKPVKLNSADDGIPHPRVKVESGFLNLYTAREHAECRFCKNSARDQVLSEVKRLIERYKGEELSITITGHSLGSALAMLSAYDIAEMGLNRANDDRIIPITVFSFAGPRVGNFAFKDRCEELGVKVLRVINVHDGVPKVPGILFNEKMGSKNSVYQQLMDRIPWSYSHVGVELALDHTHSPFLKATNDPSCFHNLEAHLHLVDGYHGRGKRFHLAPKRDPALVNKGCDFLKDHYLIPPFWRQDSNRGLVKNREGRWVQREIEYHVHTHVQLDPPTTTPSSMQVQLNGLDGRQVASYVWDHRHMSIPLEVEIDPCDGRQDTLGHDLTSGRGKLRYSLLLLFLFIFFLSAN